MTKSQPTPHRLQGFRGYLSLPGWRGRFRVRCCDLQRLRSGLLARRFPVGFSFTPNRDRLDEIKGTPARTSWPGLSASGAGIRLPSAENLTLSPPAACDRTRSPSQGVRIPADAGRRKVWILTSKQAASMSRAWLGTATSVRNGVQADQVGRPAAPDRNCQSIPMSPANSPDSLQDAPLAVRPPEFVARESGWRPDAFSRSRPGSRSCAGPPGPAPGTPMIMEHSARSFRLRLSLLDRSRRRYDGVCCQRWCPSLALRLQTVTIPDPSQGTL